ncbi:glycosyltransferase family 4 protein [Vibrio sp. G41H]|uniref:glycosyltransferase family 4 protein n=1 Tax=unclassified Vibrio TaxID=2614977 RepID=UPI001AD75B9F|nr:MULTISPECIES: glycosyltransferase family 4 protein [unclassified Vibrio]MBO7913692.1 glycosyltransferase family 4 protein [Vibrio sp. G41H]MCF7492627.1 glycosyltransferase family 4 protein [Vibrio sp. G-C-1]
MFHRDNKKILIVGSGKSFHATRWANAMSEAGFEVHFFSIIPIVRPLNADVVVHEYPTSLGKLGYFSSSLKLRKILKCVGPDLVHAHYSSGNGILAVLALLGSKTPFITSLYGAEVFEFPLKSKLNYKLLNLVVKRAKFILSTSNVMANKFQSLYPNFDNVIVTPFGVDVDLFNFPSNKNKNKNKNKITIGIVKKLEEKYGIDTLIMAFKLLSEKFINNSLELIIIGGGSQEQKLKGIVNELNIKDSVVFLGWVDNDKVRDYLHQMDVFVVPSRFQSESFGVAAVESQSCGLPTLVSNVGGLPEVIIDGETGFIVEPNNPKALYEALENLLSDPEKMNEMSIAARKHVIDAFNWKDCVSQMSDIYNKSI